jgi:hypothetical protein
MWKVAEFGGLNQFAIRNSQFAITFCNGDLTPTQNVLPSLGRGLKPPKFINLVQDLLSIVHCFSSRLYGLRKYKQKVKLIAQGVDPCSK